MAASGIFLLYLKRMYYILKCNNKIRIVTYTRNFFSLRTRKLVKTKIMLFSIKSMSLIQSLIFFKRSYFWNPECSKLN